MTDTALITGASTGIGAAFARRLAHDGLDLVLVARSEQTLNELADTIRTESGVRVTVLVRDLGAQDASRQLYDDVASAGITVDFLLNNAGFGAHSAVVDADPDRLAAMVRLNCEVVTELSQRFLGGMIARRHGTVVNVASNAAYQPLPTMAVYGATKSFVLSFTEALWHEVKGTGVRVLALCPGPTDTPFFEIAGEDFAGESKRTTDQLIATAKRALAQGRPSVVDGPRNSLIAHSVGLLPKRAALWGAEKFVAPRA